MTDPIQSYFPTGNTEDAPTDPDVSRPFRELLEARVSRRDVLIGGAIAAVSNFMASSGVAALTRSLERPARLLVRAASGGSDDLLGFSPVHVHAEDRVRVPVGYTARPFLPAGTPICVPYPPYREGGLNTGADQESQAGHHHDGMHFFPLGEGEERNRHGLLCLNHEYIDIAKLHPAGPTVVDGQRTVADEVRKEVAAHGVSVVEIERGDDGSWQVVRGRFNRRITAATPTRFSGPVRGSDHVRTRYSPEGTASRGTLNNCAYGVTPWSTYLTCEENWAFYFVNRGDNPREHDRYGISSTRSRYGWATLQEIDEYARFDASRKGRSAVEDYRNEPNTMGWIVEIDPFDPDAVPVKRTALGRFAHEGCWAAPAVEGRPVVFYMGDDAMNEYIYKFVTAEPYRPGASRGEMLDDGVLYVARFEEDGSGTWLPLVHGDPDFEAACEAKGVVFADQADVLVNTRLAADTVGATPMDRPEWTVVHPDTGEVFCTLTNNALRGTVSDVDSANPRARNSFGHIIRWREEGDRYDALDFNWDIFVLGGPPEDSGVRGPDGTVPLDDTNMFASPDGLWIDARGVLWIELDMGTDQQVRELGRFGNNALLAADPLTGDIRRFLVGPRGQEITGCIGTPDGRTLFINVQHPGEGSEANPVLTSHWPEGGSARPRSSVVVITKDDGGVVGT